MENSILEKKKIPYIGEPKSHLGLVFLTMEGRVKVKDRLIMLNSGNTPYYKRMV